MMTISIFVQALVPTSAKFLQPHRRQAHPSELEPASILGKRVDDSRSQGKGDMHYWCGQSCARPTPL